MKKLLILLLCISTLFSASAYEVLVAETGEIVWSPTVPQLKITSSVGREVTTVTYTIDSLLITRSAESDSTIYIHLDGFGYTSGAEHPQLPAKMVRYGAPRKYWQVLNAVRVSSKQHLLDYAIAIPEEFYDGGEVDTMDVVEHNIPLDSFYPQNAVTNRGYQEYRGEKFLDLAIAPVQYNKVRKEIKINTSITYQLVVAPTDADDDSDEEIAADDRLYKLLNTDDTFSNSLNTPVVEPKDADRSYLLICTDETKKAANTLAIHKRRFGYNVRVANRLSWTINQVQDSIKCYSTEDPNLYYIILMGDKSKIPSFPAYPNGSSSTSYSDFPYSCSGWPNDWLPDYYIGRLPFSDTETSILAVLKTISFENDPAPGMTDSRMGICSEFESDYDGYEIEGVTYFAHKAYEYASRYYDVVEPLFAYNNPDRLVPAGWGNNYTSDTTLPFYLQRQNHNWRPEANNPLPLIESGCNLLIHRGHASSGQWNLPTVTADDTKRLCNEVLPIVLSLNCESGRFWLDNNISNVFLSSPQGGAAAVIAPAQTVATKANHTMLVSFMNSIWPSPGMEFDSTLVMNVRGNEGILNKYDFSPGLSSLGEMLSCALNRVDQYCLPPYLSVGELGETNKMVRLAYHCLGDPGIVPFWNSKFNLKNKVSGEIVNGTIRLTSDVPLTFSICDPINGVFKRVYGTYFDYTPSLSDISKQVEVRAHLPGSRSVKIALSNKLYDEQASAEIIQTVSFIGNTLEVNTLPLIPDDYETLKLIGKGGKSITKSFQPSLSTYTFDLNEIEPIEPGDFYVLAVETQEEIISIKKIRR